MSLYIELVCSKCGRVYASEIYYRQAPRNLKEKAKKDGWKLLSTGDAICPKCQKERNE